MTMTEGNPATRGLVARVRGILLSPTTEWAAIDTEAATVKGIYAGYVVPLAAIPVLCHLIGSVVIGTSVLGVTYRPSPVAAVVEAVISYVLSLVMVYVLALIIDALAPTFNGTKNPIQAFKVAAYAATASWVAGVFGILPMLGVLAILGGLYSLFLFYKGLPVLMKAPQDKALPYVAVVIVCAIVLSWVIGLLIAPIMVATHLSAGSLASQGTVSGKLKLGGGEIDLAKLQEASKQIEATAKAQANGQTAPGAGQALPADTLKGLLPDAVAGYARTEVASSSGGVGGIQGSNAEGTYTKGDARITLSVTDMAAAGGLAGLAGAFNVTSNKETATGYEKMGSVAGRMTTERYDRQDRSGEYSVLVANRFMINAQGSGVGIDDLKAAAAAVGFGKLEGLAKG